MPRKETSPEISSLAGKVLGGYPPTPEESKRMAASLVSQDETPGQARGEAKVPSTTVPGLEVSHQISTPADRAKGSNAAALDEAVGRVFDTYLQYAGLVENAGVNWHLVLTREDGAGG